MRKLELGLCDETGRLQPIRYTSGKTQVDAIREILEAFESSDIVFFKGVVGSGKSVVGIRTALELGGGVVSVPTKVLSEQYARSYEKEKYFVKSDGSKARLGVLKGRRNFPCPHLSEKGWKGNAASREIPCRRPLNKSSGERRIDALRECKHWGFVFPKSYAEKVEGARKIHYVGISGEWTVCLKGECPYWKQFTSYAEADVVVMNSYKWMAEVMLGRIPRVPLAVVDEADEWLDSLAIKTVVTKKRIDSLIDLLKGKDEFKETREELEDLWGRTLSGRSDPVEFANVLAGVLEEIDETSDDLLWKLRMIAEHKKWVECERRKDSLLFLVPEPAPVFRRIFEKLECKWLLMSATVQSAEVLREIFGIEPVVVEGETKFPGTLIPQTTGMEVLVKHSDWLRDDFRKAYWRCLRAIIDRAKKPAFAPVHAFKYLPEDLLRLLRESSEDGVEVKGVFFSSKMDRGADLKGMRSVILLKFPFPEAEDPLLKGMKKRLGDRAFWLYYRDMAERSFIQQIGRVLRSPEDEAEFWSPDLVCHSMLRKIWKGKIVEKNKAAFDF